MSEAKPDPKIIPQVFATAMMKYNGLTSAAKSSFALSQTSEQMAGAPGDVAGVPEYIRQRALASLPEKRTPADEKLAIQAQVLLERDLQAQREASLRNTNGSFLGDLFGGGSR
jgi:hypothetical protein